MTVQAKFWVTGINHHAYQAGQSDNQSATVELSPVFGEGVNAQWSKNTPSGKIEMLITNPVAVDQFELGSEYIVNFEKAK